MDINYIVLWFYKYFLHNLKMKSAEVRSHNAIQLSYALLAAKLRSDELGFEGLKPSKKNDFLDLIEATLISMILSGNLLLKTSNNYYKFMEVLSNETQLAISMVESNGITIKSSPLKELIRCSKEKKLEKIYDNLVEDFKALWLEIYPDNNRALEKVQEVCLINLQKNSHIL